MGLFGSLLQTNDARRTLSDGALRAMSSAKPSSKSVGDALPKEEFTPGFGVWPERRHKCMAGGHISECMHGMGYLLEIFNTHAR